MRMSEEETLADRIRQNRVIQDQVQAEHNRQQEQERLQEEAERKAELEYYEKELAQYNKEQADYEIALEEYNKQQTENEKQLKEYNDIIAKEEAEQIAEKQAEIEKKEKFDAGIISIKDKYKPQIELLEQKEQEAISNIQSVVQVWDSHNNKWITKYKTKSQMKLEQEKIGIDTDMKISRINEQWEFGRQSYIMSNSNLPLSIQTKIQRLFREHGTWAFEGTMINYANKEYQSFLSKSDAERQSSITTAKSNAVKEQTKWDQIALDFEKKKDSQAKLVKPTFTKPPVKAIKKRPQVYPSSYFREKPQFKDPESIIGTTEAKSKQAVATFTETQTQQKELYWKITQSKDHLDALGLKTRYQESNPYVGTPQTFLFKGGIIGTEGVLIEKKLQNKIESYNPIASSKEILKPKIPDNVIIEKSGKAIPTYALLDDDGNVIDKPTNADLYRLANFLIDQKADMSTKADMILTDYWKQNVESIKLTKQTPGAKPLIDFKGDSFQSGLFGHVEGAYATLNNLLDPDNPKEYRASLEELAIGDLVKQGEYQLFKDDYKFYGKDPPKDSQALIEIKEKSKTPQGLDYLFGSIVGSIAIGVGTVVLAPLAITRYGKYVIQPGNLKKAQKIAQQVYETKSEKALKESLVADPNKTEKLSKAILKSNKEPVGVEMIDPKTALISAGTETAEKQSPYIVVKFGKKGKSQIFTANQEGTVVTPKEIIVKGKSGKEFGKGIKVTKDITVFPATKENLKKVASPEISKYLQPVGTKTSLATIDLEKYPKTLVGGIERGKIQTEKGIIVETEVRNVQKGFKQDVEGLPKPDSILTKAKSPKKPEISKYLTEKSKPQKINLDIPKSSAKITTKTQEPKIKTIAREMAKAETGSDFVAMSPKNLGITLVGYSSKDMINLKINPGAKTTQALSLQPKSIQQSKQELNIKQEQLLKEKDIIFDKQKTSQKQLPLSSLRYNLIVTGQQGTKQGLVPKYKIVLKEEYKIGLVPRIPPTTRPPPVIPGIYIPGLDNELQNEGTNPRLKLSKGFYAWNVDTERVGVYLPTRDLSVGRTYKVIQRVDALQRKTHTKSYAKRTIRKEERGFKKNLTVFNKSKNVSYDLPGSKIQTEHKPKKQRLEEKRFMKKMKIKL